MSVNNSNEKVLGFFDVSSVSSKRLFFNFREVFPSNLIPGPPYFIDCNLFAPLIEDDLIEQIFDFIIRDFSKFALQLSQKGCTTLVQQTICDRMIKRPAVDEARQTRVWENYAYDMKDQYEMNP